MKVCALILAGGLSSRMGTDKGLLDYKGKFWVDFVKNNLPPNIDCYVSVGEHNQDKYKLNGIKNLICDSYQLQNLAGPLRGVLSLYSSKSDYDKYLVLSCDMLELEQSLLTKLLEVKQSSCFVVEGVLQPLPFLIDNNDLLKLTKADIKNKSLKSVLKSISIKEVEMVGKDQFSNFNSKNDIKKPFN